MSAPDLSTLAAKVETWRLREGLTYSLVIRRLIRLEYCRSSAEAEELLQELDSGYH